MNHHSMAHLQVDAGTDTERTAYRETIRQIAEWFVTQLTYLIDNLKAVPEGGGTLFDNTVVVLFSDMMWGANHDRFNIPVVVAGGANIPLKMGQALNYQPGGSRPFSDLLTSIANAMGVAIPKFGEATVTNVFDGNRTMPASIGPLTELMR